MPVRDRAGGGAPELTDRVGRWRMDLTVLGCHGGETPRHRTCAFLLDETLAIDAGALTSRLEVTEQAKLETCLVSHAHIDHIRDLATLADNRTQLRCPPLTIVGLAETIDILKRHFFNDQLWPDFSRIPNAEQPTLVYRTIELEKPTTIGPYTVRAIEVSHTIACCAFIVERGGVALAYSGDTGPTERLWHALDETPELAALLMEVSFPNDEQALATVSGHHTPKTLATDLKKFKNIQQIPTLLYHIKPAFQRQVETECARLKGLSLDVLELGDRFSIGRGCAKK